MTDEEARLIACNKEVARLTEEVAEAGTSLKEATGAYIVSQQEIKKAHENYGATIRGQTKEFVALRKALKTYAWHHPGCPKSSLLGECTCGLTAALAATGEIEASKTWCQICWDRVEGHDDEGWDHKANEPSLLDPASTTECPCISLIEAQAIWDTKHFLCTYCQPPPGKQWRHSVNCATPGCVDGRVPTKAEGETND